MKIRNGFVSNSSSSSFVLLVSKEVHDKAMEKLSPYQKAVINSISDKGFFLNKEIIYIGDLSVQDYSDTFEESLELEDYEEGSDPNEEDGAYEAYMKYEEIINEIAPDGETFYWSMGNG